MAAGDSAAWTSGCHFTRLSETGRPCGPGPAGPPLPLWLPSLSENSEVPRSPERATRPSAGKTRGGQCRAPARPPASRPSPGPRISLLRQQTSGGAEGGASSRAGRAGKGRRRRLPAAVRGGRPSPGSRGRRRGGRGAGQGRRGRGSPFWPLSAAYQESEKKAHRQKSSSVRKAPLRSLISSGTRWAPAGPRPHGPGGRGRSAGTGRLQGPRPRGGDGLRARGRAEVRAGLPGCGPGRAPHRRLLQAVGSGRPRLGTRAGPGRAGLGLAARAAARPGSRAAAELAAKGGAAGT